MCFTIRILNLSKALLLCCGVALVSCAKTVVDVPEKSEVTFSVDWVGVKSAEEVNTASIYLYPKSGTEPIIVTGVSSQKKVVDVPAGTYRVIAFNENITTIQMRNSASYVSFEAYLPQNPRQNVDQYSSRSSSIETVIPSVEYLHLLTGAASREIVINSGEPYSFTLHPKTATSTYRFKLSIPTRLDFTGINAVLGGVASRMGLFEAKPLPNDISSVDIPLTMTINATKDTLYATGSIETFGVDPVNRKEWSNTLYLNLVPKVDNPAITKNYERDLTKIIDNYTNLNIVNLDVNIVIDAPEPGNPGDVEFVITVKPWIVDDGGHVDVQPDEIIKKQHIERDNIYMYNS